jgi:hypothetical protein
MIPPYIAAQLLAIYVAAPFAGGAILNDDTIP